MTSPVLSSPPSGEVGPAPLAESVVNSAQDSKATVFPAPGSSSKTGINTPGTKKSRPATPKPEKNETAQLGKSAPGAANGLCQWLQPAPGEQRKQLLVGAYKAQKFRIIALV